jgi:3-hydroxyisobutyrate dehydrogenase-like beta-hydroxyacid dehydrogenase
MASMKVAFLGLGIMGTRMAANLVKAGHEVTTWNRTPGKTVAGAATADSPRTAVHGAEAAWICVSDTEAVENALFGRDGAAAALGSGAIVADSSTILPDASRRCAARLRASGTDFVDAPMTGSKIAAESGALIFMVGGRQESIDRLRPLFDAMGKQVIRMGDVGQGEAAKLAMNLQIALIYQGFAEALTLADQLGVDRAALFELIRSSMVRSGVVDYKLPFVEKNDFAPNFPLRLMHKDIRLMLEAARSAGVTLPALETVNRVYERAQKAGMSDLDYAATLKVVQDGKL